jgi:hypothetical protein
MTNRASTMAKTKTEAKTKAEAESSNAYLLVIGEASD